jgi:hypothetical protein
VLGLALVLTVPVLLAVLLAGILGEMKGPLALWGTLVATVAIAVAIPPLKLTRISFTEQYIGPIAAYGPALILGGVLLHLVGRARWRWAYVLPIAFGSAAANLVLAPVFWVAGCTVQWWYCP